MAAIFQPSEVVDNDSNRVVILSTAYKITTHLLCICVPPAIIVFFIVYGSRFSKPPFTFLNGLGAFLGFSVYAAVLYYIAGGFDWKSEKLPVLRHILFWLAGDFIGSLFVLCVWFLIRMFLAMVFKIPLLIGMGRLLAGKKKVYPAVLAGSNEKVCESCGAKTSGGSDYSFVYAKYTGFHTGYAKGAAGGTVRQTTSFYENVSESPKMYICNKCVCLEVHRGIMELLQKASAYILVLFLVSVPLSILFTDAISLLLGMVLVFVAILGVPFFLYLRSLENAPVSAYADFCDNPSYRVPRAAYNSAWSIERGEKAAIKVKKPQLKKLGMNTFYTHIEAKKLQR